MELRDEKRLHREWLVSGGNFFGVFFLQKFHGDFLLAAPELQPHQREQIYQRMADELARLKNHHPSPQTLW